MNISKINHSNQEYGCGLGKAKLNLYNGKLGFEFPLISLGANNFKIGSSLIYNSQYKSIDFGGKKIGFGNGWKLNMHQYVFPYLSSYDIEGFEVGNYVYIDANWNIHKFVKYKSSSTYGDSRNSYYDADGTGLKLLVGSSATTQMFDQYNNTYLFDGDGRMIEVISGVNVGITKKIVYSNGNLTSIYDQRKSSRKIQYTYNSNGTLKKAYTSVNNIGFNFEYNETKLVKVIKYCSSESKDIMDFIYNSVNRIEYAISSTDLTALKFNYTTFNGEGAVQKVCFGAMKKTILTKETDAELYVGEDIYLGEGSYVIGNGKRCTGFTLSMPPEYIKKEVNIVYNGSYTQITNDKGVSINNYFNTNGTIISSLEYKDGNLFTLSRAKGWILSTDGTSNLKLDGQAINTLNLNNDFVLAANAELLEKFKEIFKDLNVDNVRDEAFSEHFSVSFWMCFKNNSQSDLKATLEYTLDGQKETSTVRYEQTNTGAWQQIVLPINLGLNQSSLSSIKLLFEGCANDTQIQVANLRIMKGGTPEIYIFSESGVDCNKLQLNIGKSLYYYSNGRLKTRTISPEFYMSENDIYLTYKSLFYSKQNNETYYDLVYNNGTKFESVSKAGIRDNNKEYDFFINEDDIPNYYFRQVNNIKSVEYILEKQISFKYDDELSKYYFENKIIAGTKDALDESTKRLVNNLSYITYSWNNEDGTFRGYEDTNNIKTENVYDIYGNTEQINIYKRNQIETSENKIKIMYEYSDELEEKDREYPINLLYGDEKISLQYFEEINKLVEVVENDKKIVYHYDEFSDELVKVTFELLDGTILWENNVTYDKERAKIINDKNNVYGLSYNIFSNLTKIHRNCTEILNATYIKENEIDKYIKKIRFDDEVITSIIEFDKYDNIRSYQNKGNEVAFEYENTDNLSGYVNRLLKISDGFTGYTHNYLYNDGDVYSSMNMNVEGQYSVNFINNNMMEYSIENDEQNYSLIEYSENILNPKIHETIYKKGNDKIKEFSCEYNYDLCGRPLKKKGMDISFVKDDYTTIISMERSYEYVNGTNKKKKVVHSVNSKIDDNLKASIEFCNETEKNNVVKVVETGEIFKESPICINSRVTTQMPSKRYLYYYDNLDRIIEESNPEYGKIDYTYSPENGNLIEVRNNDKLVKQFVYSAGKLTSISKNGIIYPIGYDAYGNIVKTDVAEISYDYRGLLTSYTFINSENVKTRVDYFYNYQGIRIKKEIKEYINNQYITVEAIKYYPVGEFILGEDRIDRFGNINRYRYFYDAEGINGINYNGINYVFVKDSLGNVSKIIHDGKTIGEYVYDAWGNHVIKELGVNNEDEKSILRCNPFRYNMYYFDAESKLYYCNFRYYNPAIYMWMTPDAVCNIDIYSYNGINLYCYCYNNPIKYFDKNGDEGELKEIYQGWTYVIHKANKEMKLQRHIHLENKQKGLQYAQNADGTVHDAHSNSAGNPSGEVIKRLRKKGIWNWKKQFSIHPSEVTITTFPMITPSIYIEQIPMIQEPPTITTFPDTPSDPYIETIPGYSGGHYIEVFPGESSGTGVAIAAAIGGGIFLMMLCMYDDNPLRFAKP